MKNYETYSQSLKLVNINKMLSLVPENGFTEKCLLIARKGLLIAKFSLHGNPSASLLISSISRLARSVVTQNTLLELSIAKTFDESYCATVKDRNHLNHKHNLEPF